MAITSITSLSAYRSAISAAKRPTVVDFWAGWCGPCKMIKPRFEALATQYPGIQCLSVDVDAVREVAALECITAMPTFVCYDEEGKVVRKVVGADLNALVSAFAELAKHQQH